MNISLTHQEFIALLKKQGFKEVTITRSHVHLTPEEKEEKKEDKIKCPSWFSDEVIYVASRLLVTKELLSAAQNGRKIEAIRLIRAATNLGLAEAKALYEENEYIWRAQNV